MGYTEDIDLYDVELNDLVRTETVSHVTSTNCIHSFFTPFTLHCIANNNNVKIHHCCELSTCTVNDRIYDTTTVLVGILLIISQWCFL